MFGTRGSQGYTSVFTWPWDGKKNAGEALCRISSIGVLKLIASGTTVVSGEENRLPKVSPIRIFEKRGKFYVRGEDGAERVLPVGSVRQLAHGGEVFNVCDVLTVRRLKFGTTIFDAVGCFGSNVSGADSIFYTVDVPKVGLPPDCGIVHLVDLLGRDDGLKTSPAYSGHRGSHDTDKEEVVSEQIEEREVTFKEVIDTGEMIGALEEEARELEHDVKFPPSQQYFFETVEEADAAEDEKRRIDVHELIEMRDEIKRLKAVVNAKVIPHEKFIITGFKEGLDENLFTQKKKREADAELAALKEAERVVLEREEFYKKIGVSVKDGVTKIPFIQAVEITEVTEPGPRRRGKSMGRG